MAIEGPSRVLVHEQTGGRSRIMKGETRMTGMARVIGLLIALALLLSLLLPLVGAAAQEIDPEEDVATTEALSEVPTTGARRPGPVILAASRIATPEAEAEPEPEPEPV